MRPLHYAEFAPGAVAADVALTYSCFTVRALPTPHFVHRVWPDGCVSLTIVCVGTRAVAARVLGVCTRAAEVALTEGARYWSVRFRPERGAAWLGVEAASLRDQNVDAVALLGDDVMHLGTRVASLEGDEDTVRAMFDAFVVARPVPRSDQMVSAAVANIVESEGRRPIADIARELGTSARTLQRRFGAAVGLTPKEFASVRRGRGALKRMVFGAGPDVEGWSGIALDAGFADQSHMAREVARLTRYSPRALHSRLDEIDHGSIVD